MLLYVMLAAAAEATLCTDVTCTDGREDTRGASSLCTDASNSDQHERLAANSHQRDHV